MKEYGWKENGKKEVKNGRRKNNLKTIDIKVASVNTSYTVFT